MNRQAKKQKSITHKEQNLLIETDLDITQMTQTVDKVTKTGIINIFCMFKNVEENMNTLRKMWKI